jgi:diketogulonate reductase-like aldo/keto reductase
MHVDRCNGAAIPTLGFGTWELRGDTARKLVESALEIGYRHIDTAQMYGNEAEVGAALKAGGLPREEIFVTTKVWPDNFRRGDLERSADQSLARLGLTYVDLLLLHWPSPDVPLAETMEALNAVAERGQARHIGVSNFNTARIDEAVRRSARPLVTNQVEYHPFLSQDPVLARCRERGMSLTAYCPLARGRVFSDPTLARVASAHGKGPGQVALRWLVQQDGVIAIPRSSSAAHARANFAIDGFELTAAEMAEITALAKPAGRIVDFAASAPAWDAA